MRIARAGLVVVAVATLIAGPSAAFASGGFFLGPITVASGGVSPFAGCTIGAVDATSVNYPNTEVEPFVAVNPTNVSNIIGAFQQDRWSDGGSRGLVASSSFDNGTTWSQS